MTQDLIKLFERDLNKLIDEIKSYKDEKQIWLIKGEIKNSSGNLCLHLIGNLNHFIGAVLGKSNYLRNRNEEFSKKDVSVSELVKEIEKVKKMIDHSLKNIKDKDLDALYPIDVTGTPMTTRNFLLHLYGHLNYHLGQINYHRRLIHID